MFDSSQGVCQDEKDLDVFFPNDDGVYEPKVLRYAKFVCMGCPIRTECREEGLKMLDEVGVWGGLTERERRRVARGTDKVRPSEFAHALAKEANSRRARMASDSNIPFYIQGLEQQGKGMPVEFRRVLEARIANPDLSLAQLGQLLGLTKDSVTAKLRRVKESVVSGKKLIWSTKGTKYAPREKAVLD
jgi:WhiB family redox-sensing transcriptional regulator